MADDAGGGLFGSSMRLVALQFSFSNPDLVPKAMKHKEHETKEERSERKSRESGVQFLEPVEGVCMLEFLSDLEHAGYEMTDAWHKPRINVKTGETYHMVRFLFVRSECATVSDFFKRVRRSRRRMLEQFIMDAAWRVRGFFNPVYKDGKEVPDQFSASINLEVRQPYLDGDGKPKMEWRRDGAGNRIGDAPVPLHADYCLRVEGDALNFVEVRG